MLDVVVPTLVGLALASPLRRYLLGVGVELRLA